MATKNQEYKNANYDRLAIWIKKGCREDYKQSAAELGISLAMLVQCGVEEYIKNHGGEVAPEKPESISAADKKLIDEFNQLPVDARKHFLQAFKAINEDKPAPIVDAREDKKLNSE